MSRVLDVYLHEHLVGKLSQDTYGRLQFQYDKDYAESQSSLAISLSMPIRLEPYEDPHTRAFFSGLLPDDIARHRLARFLGISEKNSFALLEIIGGECAGALSLYPEGEPLIPPKQEDIEILDNNKLREILDLLKRRPLMAGQDNLRLSLAGAQDKIAVTIVDGSIALVKGTTPTSHILKPLIEDIKDSVHNEYFCLALARSMNIETPEAEIHWLGYTPYFLVKRYDRKIVSDKGIKRLHQEDLCQALGILPELKYEREGGPSIASSLELLQKHSLQPAVDRLAFIQRVIFNFLIGNADAHGKNYSLLYTDRLPILAPAYDLLCTAIYPNLSNKMAMRIGGKYDQNTVFLRHWHQLVPDTTAAKKALNKDLIKMSKVCLNHAHNLKESLKEKGISSPIFEDICQVIKKRSEHIFEEL